MTEENNHQSLNEKIDELLDERQQMLVLFCRVAGLDHFGDKRQRADLLQEFCQILVDYSALWHFEIIDNLAKDSIRYQQASDEIGKISDRILNANDVAVAFNDKYDASDHELNMRHLNEDLSMLGEQIAGRIEAEDQILHTLGGR
ncbi:MAG: Rsd/AlgQ family anti-sigma factor [bacterium]